MIKNSGKLDYWLEKTTESGGIDLDSYLWEWRRLMILLNGQYVGIKELESRGDGYHMILNHPSSFDLRMAIGDDKNRIKSAQLRQSTGIVPETDILFSMKNTIHLVRGSDGKLRIHRKKARRYEKCEFKTALALPFWGCCPGESKA